MAQESRLVQNISVRANGSDLLRPIETMANEISRTVGKISKLFDGTSRLSKAQRAELEQMVRRMGQLTGQASNLEKILNGLQTRKQNRGLAGLDEQALGRQAQAAAKLRTSLGDAGSAVSALDTRLVQLRQRFADLTNVGRRVGARDLTKALGTENAIRDVKQLEAQLARLDRKIGASGATLSPDATRLRGQVSGAQADLLSAVKNPRRVSFTSEIANLDKLINSYERLTAAEVQASLAANRARDAARRSLIAQTQENEAMLRSRIERGAGRFSFTETQARSADPIKLANDQERLFARAMRLRQLIDSATKTGSGASEKYLAGLGKAWETVIGRISQAIALERAYNNLPEKRAARMRQNVSEAVFGDYGMALGTRVLAVQGIFAAINALQGGARFVVEFEDALAQLQAIAGATDIEMKTLGASILDISRNTKFSAVEITQAATSIAQAGYSAAETGKVLKDALTLATASGSSPTSSVDTLTSALGAFQLQAVESTRVVDILVEALNRSKLSIEQLQQAIQYAGATAKENGIQLEELTAIAGSLANAGIRSGSTIGTGIRQLLVDLKTPTEDFKKSLADVGLTMADVDVKANGLAGVVRKLTEAGFTAQQAYDSFEVRAASAFLAFRNQIDVYDQLALSLANARSAADAQGEAMDSLGAKIQRTLNVLGELIVSISGPVVDALKLTLDLLHGITSVLANVARGLGEFGASLGLNNEFLTAFNASLSGIAVGLSAFFLSGGNPIVGAVAGIATFLGSVVNATSELERLKAATNEAGATLDAQTQTIASVDQAIENLIDREVTLRTNKVALQTETVNLTNRFAGLSMALQGQARDYDDLVSAMVRYRTEAAEKGAEDAFAKRLAAEKERRGQVSSLSNSSSILNADLGLLLRTNKSPQLAPILRFFQQNLGFDFGSLDGAGLSSKAIEFQGNLNRLRASDIGGNNRVIQRLIGELEKRYGTILGLVNSQSTIDLSRRQEGIFRAQSSRTGQSGLNLVTQTKTAVNSGLSANARSAGSGDASLTRVSAEVTKAISAFEAEIGRLAEDSPMRAVLEANILELRGQLARITSARRKADEDAVASLRGLPGGTIFTSGQVGALLQREFGVRVTDTDRSIGQQAAFYRRAGGKGVSRPTANAPHVAGRAVDIAVPGNGISPEQLAGYLEEQGFTGVKIITKAHGTGPHWHIEWQGQRTKGQMTADQAAERDAKALQQILEQASGKKVEAVKARITKLIEQAKAGTLPLTTASSEMDSAVAEYKSAALSDYDLSNPVTGLTDNEQKLVQQGRQALEAKLGEEAGTFYARLWKQIGDAASTAYGTAIKALDDGLEAAQRQNELPVTGAQQALDQAQNPINRSRLGVGGVYQLEQNLRNAELKRDRGNIIAGAVDVEARKTELNRLKGQGSALPVGSEEYLAWLEQVRTAEEAIAQKEYELTRLRGELAAKTQEIVDAPLGERIRAATAAWADQSGILDSVSKQLENGVGPALDMLTDQFATFFTNIVSGARSFREAMSDMIGAFARFVMQIIARALALMAVKAILSAFGLHLEDSPGGVVIGKKPKGSYEGGLVEGRYNGGPVHGLQGGGPVTRGFTTHDSALYNLAADEYVVRNKSVRDLGLPFMDTINKHGRKGLNKMMGTNILAASAPRQETNVYVISEKQKPQLGPNDVLVVLQEDILQGGMTKRLIKQVAQGA